MFGFIVSIRGIEIDPNKFSSIIDIPPPKNLKDLRSIQSKIQVVRRFIAQLTDKTSPFSHLLKKDEKFISGEKY